MKKSLFTFNLKDYETFSSRDDWFKIAQKEPTNQYLALILKSIEEESTLKIEPNIWAKGTEKHHIIPNFEKFPKSNDPPYKEKEWNWVQVTTSRHLELHTTRFETYGQFGDQVAINFRNGNSEASKNRIELSHQNQKKNEVVLGLPLPSN